MNLLIFIPVYTIKQYSMKKFPIMQVEQFCEIKAHTIRMWEIRHGFLKPKRTSTNLRSYDIAELQDLLNISLLNKNGYKISLLARRSATEIEQLIQQQEDNSIKKQQAVNKLLLTTLEADIDSFTAMLNSYVEKWDIDTVVKEVIFPFMQKAFYNKTRFSWWEQLIIEELKIKIITGINGAAVPHSGKTALLFLPQKQYHDLPLLLICYIARYSGIKVYYMGTNTDIEDVEPVIKDKRPHFVVTGFTAKQQTVKEIARCIDIYNPEAHLIVAGTDKASKYQPIGREKFVLNKDMFTLFKNEMQLA